MLKHVQISPLRNRADSLSLRSSTSCASSMCGSPEPPTELQRTPSRASSYSSLSEQLPQTTIKVYTSCLKIDIEYKTLGIQWDTTSKEVIGQLLRRLKMRHRDPRLFYLSMEVSVRRAGVKTILVLDDDTRPAILQACHPKGESRFCLQLKPGGLIRVHTSALQPNAQYKSLIISEETTSDELLQLLLSCYNSSLPVEQFSIYEVCPGQEYQRKLHPDDIPLRTQNERMKRGETCHFLVRRNPSFARRRQLLTALNGVYSPTATVDSSKRSYNEDANSTISSIDEASLLDMSIESMSDDLQSLLTTSDEDEDSASSTSGSSDTSSDSSTSAHRSTLSMSLLPLKQQTVSALGSANICPNCHNNFRSCEFCHKNSAMITQQQQRQALPIKQQQQTSSVCKLQLPAYSPVYNIREIRTVSHSFSSLGKDKKLLDIQLNGRFDPSASVPTYRLRPQSLYLESAGGSLGRSSLPSHDRMIMDSSSSGSVTDVNGNSTSTSSGSGTAGAAFGIEMVNNNPSKGLGHYVYL